MICTPHRGSRLKAQVVRFSHVIHACNVRYSSTWSSPFHPTSSYSHSLSISCSPSCTFSTTLRAALRTPPRRRWTLLTNPTSTHVVCGSACGVVVVVVCVCVCRCVCGCGCGCGRGCVCEKKEKWEKEGAHHSYPQLRGLRYDSRHWRKNVQMVYLVRAAVDREANNVHARSLVARNLENMSDAAQRTEKQKWLSKNQSSTMRESCEVLISLI